MTKATGKSWSVYCLGIGTSPKDASTNKTLGYAALEVHPQALAAELRSKTVRKWKILTLVSLPSALYILEASGLLGLTGAGFAFNGDRLIAALPFAIFAAPLYLVGGYPPVWAIVVAAFGLVSRPSKRLNQQILFWAKAISYSILFIVVIVWSVRCFTEPFAWTRLVLTLAILVGIPFGFRRLSVRH